MSEGNPSIYPTCSHCPRAEKEHKAAEREGVVRHKFNTNGQLIPVDPATVGKPEQPQQPRSVTTPADPILRYLLIQAGVITVEDLDKAEAVLRATGMLQTEKVYRDARPT